MPELTQLQEPGYSLDWDSQKDSYTRDSDILIESPPPVCDAVKAYSHDGELMLLSVSYSQKYAVVERVTEDGVEEVVSAQGGDIDSLFGKKFEMTPLRTIAGRLLLAS